MKVKIIFLFSLLCCLGGVTAQQKTCKITGQVTDSSTGEPLRGVYITTGDYGAKTNRMGMYLLEITQGEIELYSLYYSTFPCVSKKIILQNDTVINFELHSKILDLNEVVVTGTRTPNRLADVPVLTTLIKKEDIRKAGAITALESLVDNVPGIVMTPNAMGNNLRIKGLNSRYILFLVDGERMVSEGAGGNINLDQIDISTIERIEMINGAASALYGSNAVGAVINIITKKSTRRIEGDVHLIGQSNNTWEQRVYVGSNLKKLTTNVSGFRKSSDGFGADGGGPYTASYKDHGSSFKMGYKPTERINFNVQARYFRHERFHPKEGMDVVHPLTNSFALGTNAGWLSPNKLNHLRWSVNWDKFLEYKVLEKRNDEQKKKNSADYISARIVDTYTPTDKWELVGGLEYNHGNNYSIKTLGIEPTSKSLDDVNLFGQAEYEVFTNFDMIAGARYTYNTQFKSAFTPKLSLMYKLGGFNFRGGIGTAFRAPSIKELYYDFDHGGMFWMYGNPNLKAEKGLYNSLSVEFSKGGGNVSVSGYYNQIKNKITIYNIINSVGEFEKHYQNTSSATLKGLDFNIAYVFLKQFLIKGTYSYCSAVDNATSLQLSSNVKHSSTLSGTWNGHIVGSPFSFQLSGRVHSSILYQQEVEDQNGEGILVNTESKPYSIWKVVFIKSFRVNKHTLEFTAKIDNVFNFKERAFINPGRQFMVGVKYNFK